MLSEFTAPRTLPIKRKLPWSISYYCSRSWLTKAESADLLLIVYLLGNRARFTFNTWWLTRPMGAICWMDFAPSCNSDNVCSSLLLLWLVDRLYALFWIVPCGPLEMMWPFWKPYRLCGGGYLLWFEVCCACDIINLESHCVALFRSTTAGFNTLWCTS